MTLKTAAALTGLGCYFSKPGVAWRLCLSLQVVGPIILLSGSSWLPESPRWLLAQSRDQQTLNILRKLHNQGGDHASNGADEEFLQILVQLELEKENGVSGLLDMIKRKSYRKRILAGLLVQYFSPPGIESAYYTYNHADLPHNLPVFWSSTTTRFYSTTTSDFMAGFRFFSIVCFPPGAPFRTGSILFSSIGLVEFQFSLMAS